MEKKKKVVVAFSGGLEEKAICHKKYTRKYEYTIYTKPGVQIIQMKN